MTKQFTTDKYSNREAFSRVDLIATLAVAALLGGWFAVKHTGERDRIARCAGNLRALGQAIQLDANDHGNELVPAELKVAKVNRSWDTELFPYLNASLGKSTDPEAKEQLFSSEAHWFHCPSDKLERHAPRSYTMPARDMKAKWPPTSDDETSVGVAWNKQSVTFLLGQAAWQAASAKPESLPRLKLSIIPAPADTLLLTELVSRINVVRHTDWDKVVNHAKQLKAFGMDPAQFQSGKLNYLMIDGHVECLNDFKAGQEDERPNGIWTIKAGD